MIHLPPTRAATNSRGATSDALAGLAGIAGGIAGWDPSSGSWSENLPPGALPKLGGLGTGQLPTNPGAATGGVDVVGLAKCTTGCTNDHERGILNDEQYRQCVADCNTKYGAAGRNPSIIGGGCPTCAVNNIPDCIACAWTWIAHAGVEIALVALVLLGLYLWLK